MIDIKLIRENRDLVKGNIKKKFQEKKLVTVDEIYDLDIKYRAAKQEADNLRAEKNSKSAEIGTLMREGKKEEAEAIKKEISDYGTKIAELEIEEENLQKEIKTKMMTIPNIIDDSVPVGKDDNENVEIEKYGEPVVPSFEVPYHADIIDKLNGLDKE
jgi:seryl-tRNA synthetase